MKTVPINSQLSRKEWCFHLWIGELPDTLSQIYAKGSPRPLLCLYPPHTYLCPCKIVCMEEQSRAYTSVDNLASEDKR